MKKLLLLMFVVGVFWVPSSATAGTSYVPVYHVNGLDSDGSWALTSIAMSNISSTVPLIVTINLYDGGSSPGNEKLTYTIVGPTVQTSVTTTAVPYNETVVYTIQPLTTANLILSSEDDAPTAYSPPVTGFAKITTNNNNKYLVAHVALWGKQMDITGNPKLTEFTRSMELNGNVPF